MVAKEEKISKRVILHGNKETFSSKDRFKKKIDPIELGLYIIFLKVSSNNIKLCFLMFFLTVQSIITLEPPPPPPLLDFFVASI